MSIEKLARAICEKEGLDPDAPLNTYQQQWEVYRGAVRAVLLAMREDDKVLIDVATAICEERTWKGAWQRANEVEHSAWYRDGRAATAAMIDHYLKDQNNG